ncbi:hypothetical protein [Sphingomonas quercus]|uniref:Uncharacterized protein n=1 Tax=Sphingomonas quercus TaxID=2842451 RepID=A0ABS6BHU0_9SPHN|nr:hypothetical protein [Sphingomonas quercus]MBU3077382.1 hypothetical protein [Sphingomonas quercus]
MRNRERGACDLFDVRNDVLDLAMVYDEHVRAGDFSRRGFELGRAQKGGFAAARLDGAMFLIDAIFSLLVSVAKMRWASAMPEQAPGPAGGV